MALAKPRQLKLKTPVVSFSCAAFLLVSTLALVTQTTPGTTNELDASFRGHFLHVHVIAGYGDVGLTLRGLRTVRAGAPLFAREELASVNFDFLRDEISLTVTRQSQGENSTEETVELEGLAFDVAVDVAGDASALLTSSAEGEPLMAGGCSALAKDCGASFFSRNESWAQIRLRRSRSITINYVDLERDRKRRTFSNVIQLEFKTADLSNVSFAVTGFTVDKGTEVFLESAGGFVPFSRGEVFLDNKPLEFGGRRVRQVHLRAQEGRSISISLAFQATENDAIFRASSRGISLLAVNDEQVLTGAVAHTLAGYHKVAKQKLSKGVHEIAFKLYEKSRSVDLTNLLLSSGKLGSIVKFHDTSIYPLIGAFFEEQQSFFQELEERLLAQQPPAPEGRSTMRVGIGVAGMTQDRLSEHLLEFLRERKTTDDETYGRLAETTRGSLFPKRAFHALRQEERSLVALAKPIRARDFLGYLKRVSSLQAREPVSSDPVEIAVREAVEKFEVWLRHRLDQGYDQWQIPFLEYDKQEVVTLGLHFAQDVAEGKYPGEIVVTGSNITETRILFDIEVYDRWSWLKKLVKFVWEHL